MSQDLMQVAFAVPLGLFATFYLLARVLPRRAYKFISLCVALIPAGAWALLALASNKTGLFVGLASGLAVLALVLSWAAAALVGPGKSADDP